MSEVAALGMETETQARSAQHHYRQAYRLVETQALDRQAWLTIRRSGLGSSDAATAAGLNPYRSAQDLWLEKTGRDPEGLGERADAHNPGNRDRLLGPWVADAYARRTGNRTCRVNAILQHPAHTWMLAGLDREVIGNPEVQILKIKTAAPRETERWRHGVPAEIQLQVQHQIAVTGQRAADVAVLLAGQRLQIHRLERDEAAIERLIAREAQFWHCVETDTPPRHTQ